MMIEEQRKKIVNLAAMECGASCLMTFLNLRDYQYKYYLLNYWNLNYYSNVLMASKNIRKSNLDFLFGIDMHFNSGDIETIKEVLSSGRVICLLARANQFAFFPKHLNVMDDQSFKHMVIIENVYEGAFRVIDPIVDFVGDLTEDEMKEAVHTDGLFYFYELSERGGELPSPSAIYQHTVQANYNAYHHSQVNEGRMALLKFQEDLDHSLSCDEIKRDKWIDNNTITISSIIKTRKQIWDTLCLMRKDKDSTFLDKLFSDLIKNWNLLNFLLLKYKRKPLPDKVDAIKNRIIVIQELEERFLKKLVEEG
ncbi:hypothetical protein [Fictibacillus norfolkensis]|uniref:Butirosin biosynthesis protein H N-terminal domain-containing protein n=1 Tax=Fictibacillus norfolkensis TaxID=2762233 RepID=A0ABR8SGX1_9BACL|nr:hypothetical protein [Fictibacillus norfolkensis]MBD7962755.1 hypothetical protein [Fictibacillus norfolkensis]